MHINVLEPLAIIAIHFQIDNKAALLLVESSMTLAAKLVSGKPFCVKEFQKTRSLIISQPRENGLAGA